MDISDFHLDGGNTVQEAPDFWYKAEMRQLREYLRRFVEAGRAEHAKRIFARILSERLCVWMHKGWCGGGAGSMDCLAQALRDAGREVFGQEVSDRIFSDTTDCRPS